MPVALEEPSQKSRRREDGTFGTDECKRLCQAMRDSRRDMQVFRQERQEAIKQYVGRHWSNEGTRDKVPVPMMELAVNIYVLQLAANAPRVMCSAERRDLKPYANDLEHAVNKWVSGSDLAEQFQIAAMDAIFLMGIIKTGLEEAGYVDIGGEQVLVGNPYARAVDYEDFVIDMAAARRCDVEFMGNQYRLPLEAVQDSGLYNKKVAKALKPATTTSHWYDGDEKTEAMSRETSADRKTFVDYVNLWDLYLPKQGLILTFPDPDESNDWTEPLRIASTNRNPYHLLSFFGVPNNHTPLPPVAHWQDLNQIANELMNKAFRQALRQKSIGAVASGAKGDADRIQKAKDGELIRVDNLQGVAELKYGGADQATVASGIMAKDLFSYMAGNLDALGGLGAMSGTVGQDQLLSASASKRIQFMQQKTVLFAQAVMKDIGRFLFTDPLVSIKIVKNVKGYPGLSVHSEYNYESQKGDILDYEIKVDAHSMPLQTPSQKAAMLMQVVQGVLLPLAPILQQQGQALDIRALTKKLGRLLNVEDELSDVIIDSAPPDGSERGGSSHERTLPGNTNRTYERVNRPGATTQQKDQAMMNMMFGNKPQAAERATMMRSAG